jgi:hypothetical protein
MAKVRLPDPQTTQIDYWCAIVHVPIGTPAGPGVYHIIYGYYVTDVPYEFSTAIGVNSMEEASEMARHLVAMPMVARDMCSECRSLYPGPIIPRWNIYRAPNNLYVPACIYWDYYDGYPPGYPPGS